MLTRASLDVGEEQASKTLPLQIGVDKQGAKTTLSGIELGHSDEAPPFLCHHRFDGPDSLDEEMGGVSRVDGAPLRAVVVRSATVLHGPIHEPQDVGDVFEAKSAQRRRTSRS